MSADAPTVPRPSRQEVWLVAMGAARPGEIGKTRPAVVVSRDELQTGSPYDRITVVPFTANPRQIPDQVRIALPAAGGLLKASVALCDAPFAAAPSRFLRRLGRLADLDFSKILAARALIEGWPPARPALRPMN
ncbi:MAG: type II toxin-antitoxin system PemK/MazF family toxin [Bifidobacteriaceae bacterium]|jgi:mRNA interferase MazF|nr:type II toxin-antitoxin system PemK/MazF family toxin [Bifidobacteriaceae bacterium]